MATAAYAKWNAAGRPLSPCTPVREIVGRLKIAFPRGAAAALFGWYADEAHYQAAHPLDHTPYSETPWPVSPCPYPFVFATDVMHRPDLGVDCVKLFAYWIAEARAGRMPWLKYIIWQAKLYHARTGFQTAESASGHFDHIHLSTRTDHQYTSLGSWVLVPGTPTPGGTDMFCEFGQTNGNVGVLQTDINEMLESMGVPPYDPSAQPGTDQQLKVDSNYGNATAKQLLRVIAPYVGGDPTGHTYYIGEYTHLQRNLRDLAAKRYAEGHPGGGGDSLTVAEVEEIAERVAEQEIADTAVTVTLTPDTDGK